MNYFCAIDEEDIIWGISLMRERVIKNAQKNIDSCIDLRGRKPKLLALECTKELFDEVNENGYCHDSDIGDSDGIPYWQYNYKKQIAYLPKPKKRKNVFAALTK